jgi:hypothetical protein
MEKGSLQSGNTFFPALISALNSYTAEWHFYDFAPAERVNTGQDYLHAEDCKMK